FPGPGGNRAGPGHPLPGTGRGMILAEARERVRRQNGGAVGRSREELITPALVLDIDAAQRNIEAMAGELRRMGAATIRPHYKAHKSPDLAWRQVQAGAGGVSAAAVWGAAVLADARFAGPFGGHTVSHPAQNARPARRAA